MSLVFVLLLFPMIWVHFAISLPARGTDADGIETYSLVPNGSFESGTVGLIPDKWVMITSNWNELGVDNTTYTNEMQQTDQKYFEGEKSLWIHSRVVDTDGLRMTRVASTGAETEDWINAPKATHIRVYVRDIKSTHSNLHWGWSNNIFLQINNVSVAKTLFEGKYYTWIFTNGETLNYNHYNQTVVGADGESWYAYEYEIPEAVDKTHMKIQILCGVCDWTFYDPGYFSDLEFVVDRVELLIPTPVHNIDTGLDYATIQEAIDAPETQDGHTILVDAGTYYETITVDKSVNLVGENREATIIDGSESMTIILVKADHVSISNFTVQNSLRNILVPSRIAEGGPAGGIALEGCISCTITNNTMEQCGAGIAICIGSGNNIITGNAMQGGHFAAMGITDWAGPQTPVGGNNISFNHIEGFECGILLDDTTNDEIDENRILSSNWGIGLGGSNNKITHNVIKGSKLYGILLYDSSGNTICHNDFIDNTIQVYDDSLAPSTNMWNDGYPSCGNYWSDYDGVDECWGENQDLDDSADMIGDTSYVIDEDDQDVYPLMDRWSFQGDINRDGKVNIIDISMTAAAFGSDPTHPRWNYKADVDRNGVLNIIDLALIAKQFGATRWEFE